MSEAMRVLFLDDDENRHERMKRMSIGHVVDHVRTAEEAIAAMRETEYDLACLDHDLGGLIYVDSNDANGTGYTVAKALTELPIKRPKQVIVHSFNPVGAQRMARRLHDAGFRVVKAPFGTWCLPGNVVQ